MNRKRHIFPAGSPPRGRGKVRAGELGHRCRRITPAWAGKSFSITARGRVRRDHPRVGGEKSLSPFDIFPDRGSPPRGRGKDRLDSPFPRRLRITPAWAGKSFNRSLICRAAQDHPRVGGEKMCAIMAKDEKTGSPPRGRGKAWYASVSLVSSRITPAWAGKRLFQLEILFVCQDHPRVGGEKKTSPHITASCQGSPPRGRGKD